MKFRWFVVLAAIWCGIWGLISEVQIINPDILIHGNPQGIRCVLGTMGGFVGFVIGCFLQDFYTKFKTAWLDSPSQFVLSRFGLLGITGVIFHIVLLLGNSFGLILPQVFFSLEILWLLLGVFILYNIIPTICLEFELNSALIEKSFLPGPIWLAETNWLLHYQFLAIWKTGFLEGNIIIPRASIIDIYKAFENPATRYRAQRVIFQLNLVKRFSPTRLWITPYCNCCPEPSNTSMLELAMKYHACLLSSELHISTPGFERYSKILESPYKSGDKLKVRVTQKGRKRFQAMSILEDGTMVLIDDGYPYIGYTICVEVKYVLQSVTGEIVFSQPETNTKLKS